ncbi:MAG: AsmA-like C-terminal region-containing protein [Marinilabiliales bacterium]
MAEIQQNDKIKTRLVKSIIVTLLCSVLFGIIALINAFKTKSKIKSGDFEAAAKASRVANRWAKVGIWYRIILIVLIIASIFLIPVLFKDDLIKIAKDEINNNVKAKVDFGDFDLSVLQTFPNLNFSINDVEVVGVDEFENDTLAIIKNFRTKIGILSILSDQYKIKSIIIDDPVIKAKVLPGGLANWDIALPEDSVVTDTTAEESSTFKLALNLLKINNATVVYDDLDGNMYAEIKGLDFELSGDLSDEETELKTKTNIAELTVKMDGISYLKKANASVMADLHADLVNSKYSFLNNVFKLNELEVGIDGWVAMPDTNIDMDIKVDAKKTEFKNILSLVPAIYMKDFEGINTSGNLTLNAQAKGIYNASQLPSFHLKMIVDNGMFQYPDLPGSANNIQIKLLVDNEDGNEDHTIVNLEKFHVDFAGNPFDMSMLVTTPVSDPSVKGYVKGTIELDKVKNVIPIEETQISGLITSDIEMNGKMSTIENEDYENFQATGNIKLTNLKYSDNEIPPVTISEADINVSPKYVELSKFNMLIGKSDISMNGKIENFLAYYFRDELLTGSFNFVSRNLDLNELAGDATDEESQTDATSTEEELELVEVPKNINFTLNTQIDKLIYDNIEVNDINGGVIINDGEANLKDVVMKLLDGILELNGLYSTRDITKPFMDLSMQIKNFDIQKTFIAFNTVQKLAPIAEDCSGKFSMMLTMNSNVLQTMEPDLATLNGQGEFHTKNIIIQNSTVFKKVGELIKTDKFDKMNLSDVDFMFTIENGKITVEPFETEFGKSKALFGGSQSLDQTLDYNINFKIPSSELGSTANQVAESLFSKAGNIGIDMKMPEVFDFNAKIGGLINDPKVTVDLKDQASDVVDDIKDQVKEKVEEEIDKAKQEAIRKAEQEAARIYAEADKQAKNIISAAEKTAEEIKKNAKVAADKVRNEAYAQADNLIKEAGNNPVKKKIAQESAKKIRQEADKKAAQLENEAAKKADNTVNAAKKQADEIRSKAKKQGDQLIEKAKNS